MSDKFTSSKPIKAFATVMFVLGVICDLLMTATFVIVGLGHVNKNATQYNVTALTIVVIVGAVIFFGISLFLLIFERALLVSYAEIAEDIRDVRNILARRDTKV